MKRVRHVAVAIVFSVTSLAIAQDAPVSENARQEVDAAHAAKMAEAWRITEEDSADVVRDLKERAQRAKEQDQYAMAEVLLKAAIEIREKVIGPDHPDMVPELTSLVDLYDPAMQLPMGSMLYFVNRSKNPQYKGTYARTESIAKRLVHIQETALGPDNVTVAVFDAWLAMVYQSNGDYAAAEPLYRRALAIREKSLGRDDPQVAAILIPLVALHCAQGNYETAEALYKRALSIGKKAPADSTVPSSVESLRIYFMEMEQPKHAELLSKWESSLKE